MWFVLLTLPLVGFGRRIGWGVSKAILYPAPWSAALIVCVVWGACVAWCIHALIQWQRPNLWVRLLWGYPLGCYVAIPNFGLLNENTIPEHARPRHLAVSQVPMLAYILCVVLFAVVARK